MDLAASMPTIASRRRGGMVIAAGRDVAGGVAWARRVARLARAGALRVWRARLRPCGFVGDHGRERPVMATGRGPGMCQKIDNILDHGLILDNPADRS
ncbi:MAG: hypothetical protein KGL52_04535 [Rhodospirillales bacterium]|nr:hypothetical protein [Rhodospirillales bacterium]